MIIEPGLGGRGVGKRLRIKYRQQFVSRSKVEAQVLVACLGPGMLKATLV